jgi:hypothetical protein
MNTFFAVFTISLLLNVVLVSAVVFVGLDRSRLRTAMRTINDHARGKSDQSYFHLAIEVLSTEALERTR